MRSGRLERRLSKRPVYGLVWRRAEAELPTRAPQAVLHLHAPCNASHGSTAPTAPPALRCDDIDCSSGRPERSISAMLLRGGQYRTHQDHRIDSAMLEFVSVAGPRHLLCLCGIPGTQRLSAEKPDAYGGVKIFVGRGSQLGSGISGRRGRHQHRDSRANQWKRYCSLAC